MKLSAVLESQCYETFTLTYTEYFHRHNQDVLVRGPPRYFLRYWRTNPGAFSYELVVGNSSGACCLEGVIATTES